VNLHLSLALLLAVAGHQKLKGIGGLRPLFFRPSWFFAGRLDQ